MCVDKANARRKIGLDEWSKLPGLRTLNIIEGHPSFKRNVEMKLEGNNKTS